MAYRPLKDGDLVRVTGKFVDHSGRNAIVIDAGDILSRIQIQSWSHLNEPEPSICLTIHNDHLKIRHEPNGYIIDGRIDAVRRAQLEARPDSYCVVDDYEDEFDGLDRDDLVDMIVKLRNDVSTLSDSIVDKDAEIIRLKMEIEGF